MAGALEGASLAGDRVERACHEAADRLEPPADVRTSTEYRRAALGVLAARAVREAAA
ncbi:MAG: hypothetical protein LBJ87_10660 [bacterium]|nr:hypothetical protein [bacterium]